MTTSPGDFPFENESRRPGKRFKDQEWRERAISNTTRGRNFQPSDAIWRSQDNLAILTWMVAGEEYLAAIVALDCDRRARVAFQNRVLKTAAPGTCLLDFGAGPGIDAKFYAARGFRVIAYDIDPRMCASFERLCKDEIASGQVTLFQGDYWDFIARKLPALRAEYDIKLVTANFAPLSLIDDPHELFARLHQVLSPGGKLLASVLNPNFVSDLRYRWWWTQRLSYWRQGYFSVAGNATNIYRRSRRNFDSLARPYFRLESVARGLPDRGRPPLSLLTSRYLFLTFGRQGP
jgi:SAM-dependent methyltransferase